MLRIVFGIIARRRLAMALPRETLVQVWQRACEIHRGASGGKEFIDGVRPVPASRKGEALRERSLGVKLLLRVLAWDRALYLALRESGEDEATAAGSVADINWELAGPGSRLAFGVAALAGGTPIARTRRVVDALFAWIFAAPFERVRHVVSGEVAFDVTRCPLAEYFDAGGVPELTPRAVCALDYRMADVWGVGLVRTQTIAEGRGRCDFRFVSRD